MSLKARIEAVIYAAEEPVTLAQLAVLFGEEALEQKLAREAAAEIAAETEEVAETLAGDSATEAEIEAAMATAETELAGDIATTAEATPEVIAEAASEELQDSSADVAQPTEEDTQATDEQESAATAESGAEPASEPNLESDPESEPESELEPASTGPSETAEAIDAAESLEATEPAEAAEIDEKKLARQREREIRDELRLTLEELIADYAASERGMEIREVAGGYRIGTRPEYHDAVRAFVKSLKPPMKLSLQALETLAVIAYKQPITAPEVGEIRGVDSAGVIGSLISRKLVTTAGRKQVIGRPILYKTTKEFLLRFGMRDLNELPSMEEFEKMAGELAENTETEPLPFTEQEEPSAATAEEANSASEAAEATEPEATEKTGANEPESAAAEAATSVVEVPGPAGRARVEVRMEDHDGAIALTDESHIFADLPGVAVNGAEAHTTEAETEENPQQDPSKEEPRG